jgi:hypothetical protein
MPYLVDRMKPCPCGSGKVTKRCCWQRDGTLLPPDCLTETRLPKTGFKNTRCYASELADCSDKMTREHFLSKGILENLTNDGIIRVSGFPWQSQGQLTRVTPNNLTARVLCDRHNHALSSLDKVAKRFIDGLHRVYDEFATTPNSKQDWAVLFNGHDVERWMVKLLCGAVYSGNVTRNSQKVAGWIPSPLVLRILFGQMPFPKGWGMYLRAVRGEDSFIEYKREISFNALVGTSSAIGLIFQTYDRRLVLALADPPRNKDGTDLADTIYRPHRFTMSDGASEKTILFGWRDRELHQGVTITHETSGGPE